MRNGFYLQVHVNGRRRSHEDVPDPFFISRVRLGLRDRLVVLFGGRLTFTVGCRDGRVVQGVMSLLNDAEGAPR